MSVPSRVLFRESQLLRATDLQAEQQYLLALAGRHHLAPHTWGIVRGLTVSVRGDALTVQPGLAIDGYGRELVISRPIRSAFPPQPSMRFVYLYYCERPQGSCGPRPNPRFRDSAEIQIAPMSWPIPEGDPDLTSATAAGRISGSPAWPVLLAIINARRGEFHVHTSHCLYTRLHDSLIRSPSGTALVRIGAENLADPYQFRVSLKAAANFQNRFALDRDGNAIFWGNLILTSAKRGAIFATQIPGRFISAQVKADVTGLVHVKHTFVPGRPSKLLIAFRVKYPFPAPPVNDVLQLDENFSSTKLREAIKKFNRQSKSVKLRGLVERPDPRRGAAFRGHSVASPPHKITPVFDDRELPLDFSGADLSFAPKTVDTTLPCDCLAPVDNPELLPEGFMLLPGATAPSPPARDIYRIQSQPEGQPPSDETRISGGAKKDGDFGRRISISGQNATGFTPLLTFRGNGGLALPADLSTAAMASHLLYVVGGTAQLPIVKPDPRDPLFNYLLVRAFIQGVMSASSQLIKVAFPNFPTFFESGQNLDYDVTFQNLSTTGALTHDKCSETLVTNTLAVFGSVPFAGTLQPFQPPTLIHVSHTPNQIPTGAISLQVEIDISMKLDTLSVGGKMRSPTVPILPSPAADLSALTDHIHKNDFFDIIISNDSDVDLVLTQAKLTSPSVGPSLLAGSLPVSAGQSQALPNQAQVTASPGQVQFTLSITYHRLVAGVAGPDKTLTFSKSVKVD